MEDEHLPDLSREDSRRVKGIFGIPLQRSQRQEPSFLGRITQQLSTYLNGEDGEENEEQEDKDSHKINSADFWRKFTEPPET